MSLGKADLDAAVDGSSERVEEIATKTGVDKSKIYN